MSLQTEMMRGGGAKRSVRVLEHDDGTFSGIEYVDHPTPSGSERWLPTYSDNRRWPTKEKALEEFTKILPEPQFP